MLVVVDLPSTREPRASVGHHGPARGIARQGVGESRPTRRSPGRGCRPGGCRGPSRRTSPPFSVKGSGSTMRCPGPAEPVAQLVARREPRASAVPSQTSARTSEGFVPSLGCVASTPATTGPALVAVTVRSVSAGRIRSGGRQRPGEPPDVVHGDPPARHDVDAWPEGRRRVGDAGGHAGDPGPAVVVRLVGEPARGVDRGSAPAPPRRPPRRDGHRRTRPPEPEGSAATCSSAARTPPRRGAGGRGTRSRRSEGTPR